MLALIVIYFVLAYFIGWWPFQAEEWQGYVYPDRNNLSYSQSSGIHKSLEQCRDASVYQLLIVSSLQKGDYECGLNCEYQSKYGIGICEKTAR